MALLVPLSLTYFILLDTITSDVVPDVYNATGEYYTRNSTTAWQSITCTHAIRCSIQCVAQQSCELATIDASNSATLILNCTATDSCQGIDVIGPSDTANIDCGSRSCYQAQIGSCCSNMVKTTFNLANTKNVNLFCKSSSKESCRFIRFDARNAETVSITCVGNSDCENAIFYLDSVSSSVNIIADGDNSLESSIINAENANELSVACNAESACSSAVIYPPYHDLYVFSLQCTRIKNACDALSISIPSHELFTNNWADVWCPLDSGYLSGICDVQWLCEDLSEVTYMEYSLVDGRWECDYMNQSCCPWSNPIEMSKLPTKSPSISPTTTLSPTTAPSMEVPLKKGVDDMLLYIAVGGLLMVILCILSFVVIDYRKRKQLEREGEKSVAVEEIGEDDVDLTVPKKQAVELADSGKEKVMSVSELSEEEKEETQATEESNSSKSKDSMYIMEGIQSETTAGIQS